MFHTTNQVSLAYLKMEDGYSHLNTEHDYSQWAIDLIISGWAWQQQALEITTSQLYNKIQQISTHIKRYQLSIKINLKQKISIEINITTNVKHPLSMSQSSVFFKTLSMYMSLVFAKNKKLSTGQPSCSLIATPKKLKEKTHHHYLSGILFFLSVWASI